MDIKPDVKPEIVFVFDLIRQVEAGRIRIPSFQRFFVWDREEMLDLLDSIRNQYPIGSLLLWTTDRSITSREWVGPVHVLHKGVGTFSYILDGQQRLTTLVGTLRVPREGEPDVGDSDPGRWRVYFNAEKEMFEYLQGKAEAPQGWHFPVWKLMDTVAFLEEGKRIMHEGGEKGQHYMIKVQELARTFQSYKLPIINISNTELSQAVTIFSRLNAKGRAITTDEMVSALTYSESDSEGAGFHLSGQIDGLIEKIAAHGFGGMDRTIILRAFLAAIDEDIYRTDWTRMAEDKKLKMQSRFIDVMAKTGDALVDAIQFLHTLGVYTDRLLPYAMQLVVLSAFFFACAKPTPEQKKFLCRWFWISSFSGWFGSGNPSRVAAMVREFKTSIATNPAPSMLESMGFGMPAQPFPQSFDIRSARTRTLMLVLLAQHPQASNGKAIAEPWRWIAERGSAAFGYIFSELNQGSKSSPANRIFRQPGGAALYGKDWLKKLQTLDPAKRRAILSSHAIPEHAFPDLLQGQRVAFLRARENYMVQLEKAVMIREAIVPPENMFLLRQEQETWDQRAIEFEPTNAGLLGKLAVFMETVRRDYEQAESLYRRAIESDPNDARHLGNFADFMENIRRDYEQAESLYRRAIESDPNHANT
ncbi:MAG: DUF262 domain-containing protein, partial [Magnetococcales bacterium]|nr:DUF262 domain-containing protein [Magnetococcales bacterium]